MKDYNEMAESVLNRRDKYIAEKRKKLKSLTAVISCSCLLTLLGLGVFQSEVLNIKPTAPQNVTTDGNNTTVPSSDSGGRELIIETTGGIVSDGTNKINPNAAADLTLEALYEQIGELLPNELPEGFLFESALLSDYGYSVLWSKGLEDINWKIRDYKEEYSNRITSVDDKKNYDLALYPIPRAESVPEELFEIVDDPIFRAEDLTLEAVKARAYKVDEIGDSKGYRMMFSVLYGKKLVTVISKGVSPEWLFECLSGLSSTDY